MRWTLRTAYMVYDEGIDQGFKTFMAEKIP